MSKLEDAMTYHMMLDSASMHVPEHAEAWVHATWERLLDNACDMIASALNPQSMTDIREYPGGAGYPDPYDDYRLAAALVGKLINKVWDAKRDPSGKWFDYPTEIGFDEVLQAPVETPQQLLEWLFEKRREFEASSAGQ